MFHANDFSIMSEIVYIIEKTTTALVDASKETVLKVNADKAQYMVMSLYHNAGRSQYVKTDDSSFQLVVQF
jgi:hypothetical protein